MTHTEQAIQKAIEGGYKATTTWKNTFTHDIEERANAVSVILLDPLFWSSLGKSLGWTDDSIKHVYVWKYQWHMFIDHLAEGKDAESFFESLINVKE